MKAGENEHKDQGQVNREFYSVYRILLHLRYTAPVMNASTFDTLAATQKLEAAGMERAQAEAIAATLRDAASADLDRIATKADLYQVALAIVIANAAITFGLPKLL